MTGNVLLPNWLDQRAAASPDHPALIVDGQVVTYAVLARRARAASGRLRTLGVRRGDRVAVLLRNDAAFVEIMHALTRLGAVLVPCDRRLAPPEIHRRLQDARVFLLLYDRSARGVAAGLDRERAPAAACVEGDPVGSDPLLLEVPPADTPPEEETGESRIDLGTAQGVIYTSGSGGRAKGALLTYGNHFWNAVGSGFNLGIHADDRWLACLPFCHVGGLSILLRSVIYGTTAVIHDGFDAERVNRAIYDQRVTIVSVVANMLQRLLDARGRDPYPPWLRCVLLGGGPAPRALLEECANRRLPIVQTYGLTEAASQVATLSPRDALRKLGSSGKPLLAAEVRIGEPGDLPAAEAPGEILVRGPIVSPGYISDDQPVTDNEGWLHTGDLGRLDDEGFLYVVGRADDMFVSGGENVHAAEIEAALQSHPAVGEALVTAVPDAEWGTVAVADVRLRSGKRATAAELRRHARTQLAGFKVPSQVRIVDNLPHTASGKVVRQARGQARGQARSIDRWDRIDLRKAARSSPTRDPAMTSYPRQPFPSRQAAFEAFADHVSRGKVAMYSEFGFDAVMGHREGATFGDGFDDRQWFNCHCNGGVFNLGHRNPRVVTAVRDALEALDIGNHHLVSGYRALLARRLAATTGDRLPGVVFGVGGGEAVDLAIKVARAVTGRPKIVSAVGGYHGHTGLALATGDPSYRDPFGPNLPGFVQVPFDDLGAMDGAVDDSTAAVLLEPIPATLGMPIPSQGYLAGVQRLCRQRGAKLVLDEVQTGLGRTGEIWCHQHDGLEPDVLVTGKALSGGIYPITATLMTSAMHAFFDEHPFVHMSTFGGAELGCVAALAVLDIIEEAGFLDRVRALGERFAKGLAGLPFQIRRRGLFMGFKFAAPDAGMIASKMLFDTGVFAVYANNDTSVLQFLPPLVLGDGEADELIARVRRVFG